jgi:stearoyl-CoA desaturase (Delta-9 desaturase)
LLLTGVGPRHLAAFAVFYVIAIFSLGAGLHRYFAHRAFRTSRGFQLVLGLLVAAFFGDPIGFAGRHRIHHRYADSERDFHGPQRGFWFGWFGHLLEDGYAEAEILKATPDLARFPELVWLHRYAFVPGLLAAGLTFAVFGWPAFAAGYCLSWCAVAIHGASAVNYLCHKGRRRRFATPDHSSNSPWLGVLLFGEGWHNNHHRFPRAARAGLDWHEPDLLYLFLKLLSWTGLIWDLREPRLPTAEHRSAPA